MSWALVFAGVGGWCFGYGFAVESHVTARWFMLYGVIAFACAAVA